MYWFLFRSRKTAESELVGETLHLTDACFPDPKYAGTLRLRQGYRVDELRGDPPTPVLAIAVHAPRLLDVFCDLMSLLAPVVDVVLEYWKCERRLECFGRTEIDRPVLESSLRHGERLLLESGGVLLRVSDEPSTVMLDTHKVIMVYAEDPRPFREVLGGWGIEEQKGLHLMMDVEHHHMDSPEHHGMLEALCADIHAERFLRGGHWS